MGELSESKQVGNKKQLMPEGYTLHHNGALFFWVEDATGEEGACCWNKWRVRRWAIKDKELKLRSLTNEFS